MDTAQWILYGTGLASSVIGTVMWAWNDFGVWLVDVLRDLGKSLVGLVRRNIVIQAPTATATAAGGSAHIKFSPGEASSLEQKVQFLLDQDKKLEVELWRIELAVSKKIEDLRADLRDHFVEQINLLRDDNIRVRRAGVAFVVIGILLLAVVPLPH